MVANKGSILVVSIAQSTGCTSDKYMHDEKITTYRSTIRPEYGDLKLGLA